MANANVSILTTANTFLNWMVNTNNLANLVNALLNGSFYADNGSLTLANGTIVLAGGSGTLLSVSGNATISQQLTSNTILNFGDITVQGNNGLFTSNTNLIQVANTLRAKFLISNTLITAQNVNAAGSIIFTGNNLNSNNSTNVAFFNELSTINVNGQFFITNTGNVQMGGTLYANDATGGVNVAGTVNVAGNTSFGSNATVNIAGNLKSNFVTIDSTGAYYLNQGNAVFNNLTVQGNTVIVGTTINTTDTLLLRANAISDGDGKLKIYRGTSVNANAEILFNHTSAVWQATANDQLSFNTILTTANIADNFLSNSPFNVASANSVNAAYAGAVSNATAIIANNGVFVAQRKGINFLSGSGMSLNVTSNSSNTSLVDITLASQAVLAGSDQQIQYNSNNVLGASGNLKYDYANSVLTIVGASRANIHNDHYANAGSVGTATQNLDIRTSAMFDFTLVGNPTVNFMNAAPTGNVTTIQVLLRQSANGSNTVTWGNTVRWSDNAVPVLSTTANTGDMLQFTTYNGGTIWWGAQVYANVPLANTY